MIGLILDRIKDMKLPREIRRLPVKNLELGVRTDNFPVVKLADIIVQPRRYDRDLSMTAIEPCTYFEQVPVFGRTREGNLFYDSEGFVGRIRLGYINHIILYPLKY